MSNNKWVTLWGVAIMAILIAMCCYLPDDSNLKTADTYPSRRTATREAGDVTPCPPNLRLAD